MLSRVRTEERDRETLRRRMEMLALPVVPLRREGYLEFPPDSMRMEHSVTAAVTSGVGPDGELLAYYAGRSDSWGAVTRASRAGGESTTIEVHDAPANVRFVQPLPDGGFLLSASRQSDSSEVTCRVYDAQGVAVASGSLGDAVIEVLSTPSGEIWVGYFDENPRGVARFTHDLHLLWSTAKGMPNHFDCYALNVDREVATTCAYTAFHLTQIEGDTWKDLGPSPQRGARALLIDGDKAVLVGGYGAEYDVLTPVRVSGDGVQLAGELRRLVMPDGLEVTGPLDLTSRGSTLHAVRHGERYGLDLNEVFD